MDYKKAYKEALDRAKKELQTCGSTDCDAARQIFRLFPDLAESEDEKIRKEIIAYLDVQDAISDRQDHDFKNWIAWLKKQGEHKPAIDVPSKELIFSIWDLGNWWKAITKGRITEEYGTQLEYIQKHWHDSKWADHHLEKQDEMDNNNN